ncbi:MAG: LuxR family transcriptional regulator [Rhodocyclaceae bacterium]|nr:MAG: LuxR family transcriptional regulator [Rhodocyclaceae bacterium]
MTGPRGCCLADWGRQFMDALHSSTTGGPTKGSDGDDFSNLPFTVLLDQSIVAVERILTCWSLLDARPRLIIKRNRNLVACCQSTQAIIAAGDFLRLERGRVTTAHEKDFARFATAAAAPTHETITVLLLHGRDDAHMIVRAIAINDDLVCLSLQNASGEHAIRLPDLKIAFRLTQSEARIVQDLCNGLSPQQIAVRNSISIHTVRAHLRRCYDKLNITNREQLWHRLSAYQM